MYHKNLHFISFNIYIYEIYSGNIMQQDVVKFKIMFPERYLKQFSLSDFWVQYSHSETHSKECTI